MGYAARKRELLNQSPNGTCFANSVQIKLSSSQAAQSFNLKITVVALLGWTYSETEKGRE